MGFRLLKQGEVEVSNKKVSDEGFQGFAYAAIITGNIITKQNAHGNIW